MASATVKQNGTQRRDEGNRPDDARSENLRDSPMMARLLDALEKKEDVGHYGRLVFAMVARHFLDEGRIVDLLSKQPDQDEERARAMLLQVQERDYNPPRRNRILDWQSQQDFQMIDPDDPDSGNLYSDLRFPDRIYESINHYYEEQAESDTGNG